MAIVNANQSRYICWLGNDLTLLGSVFDAAEHSVFALNESTGALTSWKAGRAINSLAGGLLKKAGTYQLKTGTASLTLPAYVAGVGGTIDFSFVAPASPNPTPTPPTPTPTTTNYNDFTVKLEIPGADGELGDISDTDSGSTFSGYGGDRLAFNLISTTDGADPNDISFVNGTTEIGLFTFPSRYLNAQFYYYRKSTNRAYNASTNVFQGTQINIANLASTQL